jgi:hypothetical protein
MPKKRATTVAATMPAITSLRFSAVMLIEKLKRRTNTSGSKNNRAKIVMLLKRSNTPITILNGLYKSKFQVSI